MSNEIESTNIKMQFQSENWVSQLPATKEINTQIQLEQGTQETQSNSGKIILKNVAVQTESYFNSRKYSQTTLSQKFVAFKPRLMIVSQYIKEI